MSKDKKTTIEVQGTAIGILSRPGGDYVSLTDMVRNFDGGGESCRRYPAFGEANRALALARTSRCSSFR